MVENRLARSMPLQMDSTVLYAIGQDGGPVSSSTEQIRSPYNSYLNSGLPPTPICTSSVAALGATMHPAVGAWLYFTLIDKTGTMDSRPPSPDSWPTRSSLRATGCDDASDP